MKATASDGTARRPRRSAEELHAAILDAAAEVFLEQGYEGASIEAVIARVGGSKRAIYSHFGGKKELFAAIATRISNRIVETLSRDWRQPQGIEATLSEFGREMLGTIMAPRILAFYRLVVAEGVRFPELAQVFHACGPGRAVARLTKVLELYRDQGVISLDDCHQGAEHLIGLMRGDLHLKVVLGLRPPPTAEEADRAVRLAIAVFLDGCRKPGA